MMCSTQTMVMPISLRMLLQHVGGLLHLRRVEAAEAFVGQQQLRLGGERARKFELLERGGAEAVGRGRLVGRQADEVERLLGLRQRLARGRCAAGLP